MTKFQDNKQPLFVIAGPTASGKTAFSAELIKLYPFEIVSADSRQVYRTLDIGTGKDKELPQHMIDVVGTGQQFSVSHYRKMAMPILDQIYERGHIPLIVGGTGFYIESLIYTQITHDTPPSDMLRAELKQLSNDQLLHQIARVDRETASKIDTKNRVRLIRALEIIRITNAPLKNITSVLRPNADLTMFVLDIPRIELYKRIDDRVDLRLKFGMIEEVSGLINAGVSADWLISLGLEYRFITQFIQSQNDLPGSSYPDMVQKLKYAIHAYARRQLTFFRRFTNVEWLSAEQIKRRIDETLRSFE